MRKTITKNDSMYWCAHIPWRSHISIKPKSSYRFLLLFYLIQFISLFFSSARMSVTEEKKNWWQNYSVVNLVSLVFWLLHFIENFHFARFFYLLSWNSTSYSLVLCRRKSHTYFNCHHGFNKLTIKWILSRCSQFVRTIQASNSRFHVFFQRKLKYRTNSMLNTQFKTRSISAARPAIINLFDYFSHICCMWICSWIRKKKEFWFFFGLKNIKL